MTTFVIIAAAAAVALAYLIGFYYAVRALHRLHDHKPFLGEHDDWTMAIFWPILLAIAVIVAPIWLVYRHAVRDLR